METIAEGWNRLAGSDPGRVLEAVRRGRPRSEHPPLYGSGDAAPRMIDTLVGDLV